MLPSPFPVLWVLLFSSQPLCVPLPLSAPSLIFTETRYSMPSKTCPLHLELPDISIASITPASTSDLEATSVSFFVGY
jgi:hypothetical protein